MIAMTTNNSISVKPRRTGAFRDTIGSKKKMRISDSAANQEGLKNPVDRTEKKQIIDESQFWRVIIMHVA